MEKVALRHVKDYNADPNVDPVLKFRNRDSKFSQVGYVLVFPDGSAQFIRGNKSVAKLAYRMANHDYNEGYILGQDDVKAGKDRDLTKFDYSSETERNRGKGYIAGYDAESSKK